MQATGTTIPLSSIKKPKEFLLNNKKVFSLSIKKTAYFAVGSSLKNCMYFTLFFVIEKT
jgi:hypothetical protein